jgi:hypothetical protein
MTKNLPVPYQAPQAQGAGTPAPQKLTPVHKNGWGKWAAFGIPALALSGLIYSFTSGGDWSDRWSLAAISVTLIVVGLCFITWGPAATKTIAMLALVGGALLALTLMFIGSGPLQYRREQVVAMVGGQAVPTAPTAPPLSPEEQAAAEARAEQAARLATIARREAARAEEEARRAREEPVVTNCDSAPFTSFRDCREVYFPTLTGYQVTNVDDGCLLVNDGNLVTWEELSSGTLVAKPARAGISVMFFVAEFGQVFRVNNTVCTRDGLRPRS